MRAGALILCVVLAADGAGLARAQQPAAAAATPAASEPAAPAPPASDERLVFSGNGEVLSENHGGGGGSVTWLDSRGGDVLGLGVEYQQIANAHWTDGVFNAALRVEQSVLPTTLYVDLHQGSGDIGQHGFNYTVADGGAIATLTPWLSAQLEERYIDIDTSHGSLPKLGVLLRLAPTLLASVSYAYAFGGNLDTRLVAVRLDYVGKSFSWLAGGAWGPVSPAVLNLVTREIGPGPPLQEEYLGIGKSFGRTDWQLLADFQDIAGFKRETVTLNCTLHLGRRP